MADNNLMLLSITDTCKKLEISVGKSEQVERRLAKMGLFPVARVRGEAGGEKISRPLYHEAAVMGFAWLNSRPAPKQDLETRLKALENKLKGELDL